MKNRTTQPTHAEYKNYGGAGVKVCDRWLNSFAAFLEDMGERPEGCTLGRFGDIGNYSCGSCDQCKQNGWKLNVAWQTWKEQGAERRKKNLLKVLAA